MLLLVRMDAAPAGFSRVQDEMEKSSSSIVVHAATLGENLSLLKHSADEFVSLLRQARIVGEIIFPDCPIDRDCLSASCSSK